MIFKSIPVEIIGTGLISVSISNELDLLDKVTSVV